MDGWIVLFKLFATDQEFCRGSSCSTETRK